MKAIARQRPRVLPIALAVSIGLALGAFVWLWSQHGATVYLGYLAGAAFACL